MASKITKGILISCWIVYLAILGAVVMVFMAIANGSIGYRQEGEEVEKGPEKPPAKQSHADSERPGRSAPIITRLGRFWDGHFSVTYR